MELIDSEDLGLNGLLIDIGQVEPGRAGKPFFDSPSNIDTTVSPTSVFRRDGVATADQDVTDHAESVAGTMISFDLNATGVAQGTFLHASAFDPTGIGFNQFDTVPLTLQHVATQNSDNVRGMNLSFGSSPFASEILDGNSHLTKFVDWSASKHDTLYIVAGPEFTSGTALPTDNFNGLTVAASQKTVDGVYRQVANRRPAWPWACARRASATPG